jgi:hypothetical protein
VQNVGQAILPAAAFPGGLERLCVTASQNIYVKMLL